MTAGKNKKILSDIVEEMNKGNDGPLWEAMEPDCAIHDQSGQLFNKDGYRQLIGEIASVYPDYNLVIEDLIADGDKVTVRFSESGTMKGDFMGVLATGKSFMTPAIEIWRFENGRIKEMWMARDLLTTMTQTGVIPPME